MNSFFCEDLRSEALPYFLREFVERGDGGYKGDTGRAGDPEIKLFSSPFIWKISYTIRKAGWAFYLRLCFCLPRTQKSFGQRMDNESAGSDPGAKITFRMKLREGKVYGVSRGSQVSRKRSRGRKSRAAVVKASRDQFIANLAVKLLMERFSGRPIEPNHFERHDGMATPLLGARFI
jgi:hypothetical protein